MLIQLVLAALLASNGSGKTLVRVQPGTTVTGPVYPGPLILDDANTVAHVTWTGTTLLDSKGNTWAMQGTVPQVAKTGKLPPGAGPLSDTNYYSSSSAAMTFTADYTICAVVAIPASGNAPSVFGNNWPNTNSYLFGLGNASPPYTTINPINPNGQQKVATTVTTAAAGEVSVLCGGRAGTNSVAKMNLGALATMASSTGNLGNGTAVIGRNNQAGYSFPGMIYELWLSTSTPTDALLTSIMQRVKLRAGIVAW